MPNPIPAWYEASWPLVGQGGEELIFIARYGELPEGATEVYAHDDADWAASVLRRLAREGCNLNVLVDIAQEMMLVIPERHNAAEDLIWRVACLWARGDLKLLRPPRLVFAPATEEEEAAARQARRAIQPKSVFSLQLVADATDDPIKDVKLKVKLPDGSEQEATTDSSGRVDLCFAGSGRVEVKPAVLSAKLDETLLFLRIGALSSTAGGVNTALKGKTVATVFDHRVKSGDTFDTIAKLYSLTRDDLLQFNFGTTDANKVDKRLLMEVGCTKRGADKKLRFDDSDSPGIMRVPKPMHLRGLEMNVLHIVRLVPSVAARVFLFSA